MKTMLFILAVMMIAAPQLVIASEDPFQDCEDWVNCNMNSPNFNGVCCRICRFPDLGWREWVCFRVSDDQGLTQKEIDNLSWIDIDNNE